VGIYDDTTANIINEKEVNIVGSRTCNFYRLYSIGDLLNGLKNSTSVTRAGITSSDYNQLWVKITSTPQTIYRLFPAIGTDNATCTIHEPVKSITVSGIPLSNFTLHSPKEDGYTYTKQTGYVNGSVDLFIKGTYLPTNMNKHVSTTNIENISIPLSYTITYKFSDNTPSESVTLSGVKLWVNTKVKVGVGLRKKYIGYIYNEDSYDLPSLEFKRLAQRLPSENTPLNAGLLYEEQGGALQYYQPYMTELVNYGLSAGAPDTPYVFDSMPSRDEILSFPRGELIYVRDNNPIYYRTYKVTDTLVDLNKLI
jgi:hypothetical protein